jgi:two-component system, NtrC family, response regulator HydG
MNSMHKLRILILYPDPAGLALLTSMLKSLGHIIEEAANDRMAVRLMERENIDLVLAGVDPGDGDALELLTYVRRKHREVPVVLLFPRLHPERAKEALRLGAMAVLKYPVPAAELRAAVLQALEQCEVRTGDPSASGGAGMSPAGTGSTSGPGSMAVAATGAAVPAGTGKGPALLPLSMAGGGLTPSWQGGPRSAAAPEAVPTGMGPGAGALAVHAPIPGPAQAPAHRLELLVRELGLVGNDPSWRQVIELAATIAASRSPVLIAGEPGTGKTQLARLIHALGTGPDRPFIAYEAASLADEVAADDPEDQEAAPEPPPVDSALVWAAKINLARGGTFFLDDVAALPVALQLHLLRDLQFRDYTAAAGHPAATVEVRFIMSTGESLPALIEQGRFRQELYHRISVIMLTPPPLRHRGTDIELLAESFRARYSQEFRKGVTGFTRDALDILQRHDWPGNVRELEAAVQRAVAMCNGPRISSSHLAPILNHHRQTRGSAGTPKPHLPMGIRPLKEALEEPEKRIIIQALQAFNWNRQETARVLDINRTTLYKKMKKYGLLIDEPMWAQ